MFIKETKGGSKNNPHIYLQIVHNYRKDNKIKQKVICTLGRKDILQNSGQLDNIILKLKKYSKKLIIIDSENDNVKSVKLLGTPLVVNSMWKKLELDKIFELLKNQYKFEFDISNIVKTLVINRFVQPTSKLGVQEWKHNIYGVKTDNIELQHIYRTIDYLTENKDIIEKHLFETTNCLFKSDVSVVFYDLTTIYLESQKADDIKKFGYSKENKTDCVQVVIGLLINKDGLPLGYEMFPGNTFEGGTVCRMLDKLSKKFMIKQLIFVADKGILGNKVLNALEERGYQYIVAAKLRQTASSHHSKILDKKSYKKINEDISSSEITINNRRLVLGYSHKRASRDKFQRETLLNKLEQKIEKSGLNSISNPHYNKYISKVGNLSIKVDEAKVKEHEQWDGFFGFYTNSQMSNMEVVSSYRMLWQIEDSFRTLKSTLDIRPMFHWTASRIEGHIMMCFLSLYVLRGIEYYLLENGVNHSAERILESLEELKALELKLENKLVYIRNEISGVTNEVLRGLKIKIPSFILEEEQM